MTVANDTVGTDVLCDSAGLTGGNARLANRVNERCLAVIDMAHESDDGGAPFKYIALRRLGGFGCFDLGFDFVVTF